MKSYDITKLVRPNVLTLQPYRSARDEFRGEASLYLDANENPFRSAYNRYPDAQQQNLKRTVSRLKKTTPEQTLLTHGSDEAIDLLLRAFCRPQVDNVIIPQPTYGMYATCAAINDVPVREVALTEDFSLDNSAILEAVDAQTRIIFLCSPNNPSGNLLDTRKVSALLRSFKGLVVIDEAYVDYSSAPSWTSELKKFPNLVVLQTFSKAWGLAGIRAGICMANPELIRILEKIKPPYNMSTAAERTILHAINRRYTTIRSQTTILVRERSRLNKALQKLSFVRKVYSSEANFLLIRVTDAVTIYRALLDKGIVVRLRSGALHCDNCLRITVGTPRQNDRLISILKSL